MRVMKTSYLEARGLLASTLLDLIVLKYARTKEAHTVMEEKEYRKQVLPAFKKAITNVELPKSSNELRRRAKEELVGAYRTSFRKRLELLAERLDIPLSKNDCSRAVKIRNELVHEGRYLSANGDDDWYSQYRLMIWIDLVALCRLTGYDGDLPLLVNRSTFNSLATLG